MNVSRRRYMGEKGGSIPYQRIEYLKSTGSQRIDTNYVFADNYAFEIELSEMIDNTTSFGARSSSIRTSVLYYSTIDGMTVNMAGYTGSTTPFKLVKSTTKHTIKMSVSQNYGTVWVDGELIYENTWFSGNYISNISQAIFATKYGNNDYRDFSACKIYNVKMWQNNTLVRNFVPVRIDTTGYLYDIVSGELFGNLGPGNFVLGPDVN